MEAWMSWAGFWLLVASVICQMVVVFMAAISGFYIGENQFPDSSDRRHVGGYAVIMIVFLVAAVIAAVAAGRN